MTRLFQFVFRLLFRYDVFVSYSHADAHFVAWLEQRLREVGFDVVRDVGFLAGLGLRSQIKSAIRRSHSAIVVESPESQASQSVTEEVVYLGRVRLRAFRPLIPLLLRGAVRPAFQALLWVDFRGIDIDDPSHVGRRDAKFWKIVHGLRPEDPKTAGPMVLGPRWPIRGFSMRLVFFLALMALLSVVTLRTFGSGIGIILGATDIERAQQAVIRLEETVNALGDDQVAPQFTGSTRHIESRTSALLAIDTWANGRLIRRDFFDQARLIAHDNFEYEAGIPTGKLRTYVDGTGREFLFDSFSQDGLLIHSRYCPTGPNDVCATEGGLLRSPLPPAAVYFYR